MTRGRKHLVPCLMLCNSPEGMSTTLDYSFTLVNRDHFTRNEVLMEKSCKFVTGRTITAAETFISLRDLSSRGFIHSTGELLLELEMRNKLTSFEQVSYNYYTD